MATTQATGRRKTSTAKVFLKTGTGNITINNKPMAVYFPSTIAQEYIKKPLGITKKEGTFDIVIRVQGGGTSGQQGAISLGISKALASVDPACREDLKKNKLLTRDPRKVERKKAGYLKARKKSPFRKR